MSSRKYAIVGGSTGIAGYFVGKLTGGDLKSLLSQFLDGAFRFLHEQGAYASFAIVIAFGVGGLAVWSIKQLIKGKDLEISRIAENRDMFQKLFIESWQSSTGEKGPKKK